MSAHSHISPWSSPDITQVMLKQLRKDRKNSDMVFFCGNGREFHCHKCILALFTDVFDASCDFKIQSHGEDEKVSRIKLEDLDISEPIFGKILDVIYGMKPKIDLDEAVDLLFAADKLLMDYVRSYAEDIIVDENYLKNQLHRVVKLLKFPGLKKCQKLLDNVKTHLFDDFSVISRLPEFLEISVEDLCALDVLKKSDVFSSPKEYSTFVAKFIAFDLDKRIFDIKTILEYLNESSIDRDDGVLDKFISAITNMRKNNEDPAAIMTVLEFSLHGLLIDSVPESSLKLIYCPIRAIHSLPRQ